MRPPDLEVGCRIVYRDREHTVVEMGARRAALVDAFAAPGTEPKAVWLDKLWDDPTFEILDVRDGRPQDYTPIIPVETIPKKALDKAEKVMRAVNEAETGYKSRDPNNALPDEPRPEFDVTRTSQGERDQAMAAELKVGLSTFQAYKTDYHKAGNSVLGLVDRRYLPKSNPLGKADPLVLQCLRRQIEVELEEVESTGDAARLHRRVTRRVHRVARDLGIPAPEMPSARTFRNWLKHIDGADALFGPAKRRETDRLKPRDKHGNLMPFTPKTAMRPGEIVELDSSRFNVRVLDSEGNRTKAEVSFARDVCTKMLLAHSLTLKSTKARDTVGMLRQIIVPPKKVPDYAERLQVQMAAVPWPRLVEFDDRLHDLVHRPPVVPETVEVDWGGPYATSTTFLDACRFYEINLAPSRKRRPTDKPIVERGFRTFLTQFEQHCRGFTGGSVAHRGGHVDETAVWTVEQMDDLIQEFMYLWNRKVTKGLRAPGPNGRYLSPIEGWELGVARAGYVTVPAGADTYYNLLDFKDIGLHDYGFELNRLTYNGSALTRLRALRRTGKWRVRYDPNDRSRVYVQHPETEEWLMVPWTHLPDREQPFSDVLIGAAVKQADMTAPRKKATQAEIADALVDLQNRLEDGPDGSTSRLFGLDAHRGAKAAALRAELGIDIGDDEDPVAVARRRFEVIDGGDPTPDDQDSDDTDPEDDRPDDDSDDDLDEPQSDMHTGEDDDDIDFEAYFTQVTGP